MTPDSGPASTGPEWAIPRGLIVLLGAAGTVVVAVGMRAFASFLAPVFLALMLTIAAQPIQTRVQRRSWPRWVGMLGALTVVYLFLLGMVVALGISLARLATLLPTYADDADALIQKLYDGLAGLGVGSEQAHSVLSSVDFGRLVGLLDTLLQELLGVFSNVLLVLALLVFMVFDGMTIGDRLQVVSRARPEIADALHTFATGTRSYLIVTTVFGLIVAIIDGIALWLLGIPLPVLWALLAFITIYIPYIGFIIGLIPPTLIALLQGGPELMWAVIAIYCIANLIIESVIQPKFVGDAVGLSVTVVFVGVVFWGWVLGPLGTLLAVPMSLLVKAVLLDIDPATRWTDALIGAPSAGPGKKPAAPEQKREPAAEPGDE